MLLRIVVCSDIGSELHLYRVADLISSLHRQTAFVAALRQFVLI